MKQTDMTSIERCWHRMKDTIVEKQQKAQQIRGDRKKRTVLVSSALTLLLSTACNTKDVTEYNADIYAMNTLISIRAWGEDGKEAIQRGETYLYSLDAKFSTTRKNSEVYLLNESDNDCTTLSEEVNEVLLYGKAMAEKTGGAFDPTVYPLVKAWGFTQNEYRIPSQDEIDQILQYVDSSLICWNEDVQSVCVPYEVQLDFGGLAKGYAVDKMVEMLHEDGVESAMLALGGNVYAVGRKIDDSLWNIGIQNPYGGGAIGVVQVEHKAVITSGGYQRYFTDWETQETYCHIIDPRTGYPAQEGLASVTIISESGMQGDALSTALFVMGLNEAVSYWQTHRDFEMVLIEENGTVHISEGLKDTFTLSQGYSLGELEVVYG